MLGGDQIVNVAMTNAAPKRFAFVLIENFTLLSFASAVDALRIANRMSGKQLYNWILLGEGGETVASSSGASFQLDYDLIELKRDDTILICGGVDIQSHTSKRILNWVRRETRKGLAVGGLCTAAYTMAKAGILDGRRATIHWENQDSFRE